LLRIGVSKLGDHGGFYAMRPGPGGIWTERTWSVRPLLYRLSYLGMVLLGFSSALAQWLLTPLRDTAVSNGAVGAEPSLDLACLAIRQQQTQHSAQEHLAVRSHS
jgi:hypothetical protein